MWTYRGRNVRQLEPSAERETDHDGGVPADEIEEQSGRNCEWACVCDVDRYTGPEERLTVPVGVFDPRGDEQFHRFHEPQGQRTGDDHVLRFRPDRGVDQRPHGEPLVRYRKTTLVIRADREAGMPFRSRKSEEHPGVIGVMAAARHGVAATLLCKESRGEDRDDRQRENYCG